MKKLSSGTEKEVLQSATRLAEILSLEDFKNQDLIDAGKKILHIIDDPTILLRFKNGREQKLEIIRDIIVDLSAGASWLKKGTFGLVKQNNDLKKIYLLDENHLKGYFLYKASLNKKYKDHEYSLSQDEINAASYYMIYLWSQFIRELAKRAG